MTSTVDRVEGELAQAQRIRVRWNWRRPLGRLLVAAPALWLTFTLAHLLMSGRVWWWRPADLLPPLAFVLIPVLLSLGALPCRRTRLAAAVLSACGLAAGAGLAGLDPAGPLRAGGPVPPGAVSVVSWNTEYWHEPGEEAEFYDLLRAQRADVYLLQEYLYYPGGVPKRVDQLDRLRAELPGFHIAVAGELVTLSTYPIVAQHAVDGHDEYEPAGTDFPEYWRYKALRTDLQVGDWVLSVYNVHLPTPLWLGGPGPLRKSFWDTIRMQHDRRVSHLRALVDDVAANGNPILVAGDMNTTPAMGERRLFPAGLRDAAAAVRSPYPVSWPARGWLPAWWRLDWTLVSPGLTVHRYEFGDPAGLSDHRLQHVVVST